MTAYICKDRIRATEWDGNTHEYVDKEITSSFHELRTNCEIEPDVTLKDIIYLVYNDPLLRVLVGEYSWCNIEGFYKEVNRPTTKKTTLEYIILRKHIEINDDSVSNNCIDVSGAGPNTEKSEYDNRDFVDNWAIELTPVNEMADVPVKLSPTISINDWRGKEYKREELPGAYFTLLEILTEIFYEISFCGSPSERDNFSLDLTEMIDKVKSGEAKTVPFKDEESIQ